MGAGEADELGVDVAGALDVEVADLDGGEGVLLELVEDVEAAAAAGASGGFYLPVRLPHEVAPLFRAWLDEHYAERADKVMNTIRSIRGGKDNDPNWFTRMRGQGPWADLLKTRFDIAVRKHGLNRDKRPLRTDLFVPPSGPQLRLL